MRVSGACSLRADAQRRRAQVTKNSVFDSPEANVKASIRSNFMLPALAVVDPLLTLGVPPDVTAATGLDALTQCLEPYVCNACVASAGDARARS